MSRQQQKNTQLSAQSALRQLCGVSGGHHQGWYCNNDNGGGGVNFFRASSQSSSAFLTPLLHLLLHSSERQQQQALRQPEMASLLLLAELMATQEGCDDLLRNIISSSSCVPVLPPSVPLQLAAATGGGLLQQPLLPNTSSLTPPLPSRARTTHSHYDLLLRNIRSSVTAPPPFQPTAAATRGLLQQSLPNTALAPLGASTSLLANNDLYRALLALKASGNQKYTGSSNDAFKAGGSAVLPSKSTLFSSREEKSVPLKVDIIIL